MVVTFIQPTGVTVYGNCEPIYGACCDGLTGVCENNVSIFDCTGQFTEDAQCAELTPPCGNPGACCDDTTAICVDGVMQLACSGRFAAATLCAVLDPECGVVPPCEDAQLVAPGSWSGNTCGAGNDCALRSSEDLIVKVTIPTDGNWQFDLCASTSVLGFVPVRRQRLLHEHLVRRRRLPGTMLIPAFSGRRCPPASTMRPSRRIAVLAAP